MLSGCLTGTSEIWRSKIRACENRGLRRDSICRNLAQSPFFTGLRSAGPIAIPPGSPIPATSQRSLQAIEAWWEHHTGLDWFRINFDRDVGTPFVHMKLDFRSPVTPRHALECEVVLKRLGSRSVTHIVNGRQNGVLCFEGEFVAVFVDAPTMKPRAPPADILAAIRDLALEA
jgi:4-hydroxybenzoyl-CoA thioesterase